MAASSVAASLAGDHGKAARNERDACELLVGRDGAQRGRHLLGARRMLALYGEEQVRRRGWISDTGMQAFQRDLHLAGVLWPAPGEDRGA